MVITEFTPAGPNAAERRPDDHFANDTDAFGSNAGACAASL